jgi:hypothetical protein
LSSTCRKPLAVLGAVDRRRAACRESGTPSASSAVASLSGVWPPNCTMTPYGFSFGTISKHVLERQRLEVQAVDVS